MTSAKRLRLDAELVRRGIAPTRSAARRLISEGKVLLQGLPVTTVARQVSAGEAIALAPDAARFVSRGGIKLDGALRDLGVAVEGRRWMDAGASTGGFTDRLLQGGAESVLAVDVGYGQLAWSLRNDDRVVVMERTNIRYLDPADLPWVPDAVVGDLSFISLTLVLPRLAELSGPEADLLLLVKPQFEVGRDALGKGGVVRERSGWEAALRRVAAAGEGAGFGAVGASVSDIRGPAGNVEFFLHLCRDRDADMSVIDTVLEGV